jgi:hypothetical protein
MSVRNHLKPTIMRFTLLSSLLFTAISYGAVVDGCTFPTFSPDSAVVDAGDPCRLNHLEARPGRAWVYLSDNVFGISDWDLDIGSYVEMVARDGGYVQIYAQFLGKASAHDIFMKINQVVVEEHDGWQDMGLALFGSIVPASVTDITDGEHDIDYLTGRPERGWVLTQYKTTTTTTENTTPEPISTALVGFGLMSLTVWRKRRHAARP